MLQAKKRFWGRKAGFDTGDILYIGVNVIFVAIIYAMAVRWHLAFLAVILILLSKWRVLAVQPRFWLPNVKANLVDIIVGISTVMLINQTKHAWLAILWALLYITWLLFLKPQENDVLVGIQAFWAQLLGIFTIFMITDLVRIPLIACMFVWLVTTAAARHFFSNYEEPHYRTLALVWGLLMAQLAWIGLHWLQYYIIFDMRVSVLAIIIAIISASLGSVYHSYKKESLHRGVLIENMLFACALLSIVIATASWSAKL